MVDLAEPPTQPRAGPSAAASFRRRPCVLPDLPYPGIRPFQKDEWPIFCGRQRIVDDLLRILGEARFLPVLGTSGCGKSSLIKAGVIATLERECGRMGARWRTAEMRPANAPMWGLAEALWTATHPDDRPGRPTSPPEEVAALRAVLGRGPGGIARVLETYAFPSDHNFLLHVDQFEELFRFRSLGSETEAEDFVDQLIDVFDAQPRGIYVVATMRTDFIADCAHFPRLADAFNQTGYLLRRMTEGELREAIERPARLYRGRIEPQLIDRLVRDGGCEQDQLPVIEHALMWMWNRAGKPMETTLTLDDYLSEDVGGLEGALSRHADQIYEALGSTAAGNQPSARDLRPVAKRLFQALSDTDRDGRVIRRPVPFGELCSVIGASSDDVAHVIDEFRKPSCSFLMPPYGKALDGKTVIDVSHEALIRQWSKMKGANGTTDWVEQERKDGDNWQALAREARKFETNPRLRLRGDQSTEYQTWWRSREPNAAWSRRYTPAGEDLFEGARKLLQKSEVCRRVFRAAKWASASAALFVLSSGIGYATYTTVEQNKQALEQAQLKLWTARSMTATSEWQTTDAVVLAQASLAAAAAADTGAEAAAYAALARHRARAIYPDVKAIDVSPDGSFAVIGVDETIGYIDASAAAAPLELGVAQRPIDNIATGPRGTYFAVSYRSPDYVEIWDADEKRRLFPIPTRGGAPNLWFSPDGHWIGISDDEGVRIVEASSGRTRTYLEGYFAGSVVFSPDSRYVATASGDGNAMLVRLESPFEQTRLAEGTSTGIVAFDPLGRWVAVPTSTAVASSTGRGGEIVLKSIGAEEPIEVTGLADPTAVTFSPDGKWLVLGSDDGTVNLMEIETWKKDGCRNLTVVKFDRTVRWAAFSPDSALLAVSVDDNMVHVLDVPSTRERARLPTGGAYFLAFVDAGQRILTMGDDGVARLWQVQPTIAARHYGRNDSYASTSLSVSLGGCPIRTAPIYSASSAARDGLLGSPEPFDRAAILAIDQGPQGPVTLVIDGGYTSLRDPATGEELASSTDFPWTGWHQSAVTGALDLSRQRVVLVDVDKKGRMQLLGAAADMPSTVDVFDDVEDGSGGGKRHPIVGIGADGRVLAVRGQYWTEWSHSGTPAGARKIPGDEGSSLAIDADRRRVLRYAAAGQAPKLWVSDLKENDARPLDLPLVDSSDPPLTGAFSRDGRLVVIVHRSGGVAVWDTRQGSVVAKFDEPGQRLLVAGFTPNGDKVMVAAADGSVHVWPIFPDRQALISVIDRSLPLGLTADDAKRILEPRQE